MLQNGEKWTKSLLDGNIEATRQSIIGQTQCKIVNLANVAWSNVNSLKDIKEGQENVLS